MSKKSRKIIQDESEKIYSLNDVVEIATFAASTFTAGVECRSDYHLALVSKFSASTCPEFGVAAVIIHDIFNLAEVAAEQLEGLMMSLKPDEPMVTKSEGVKPS